MSVRRENFPRSLARWQDYDFINFVWKYVFMSTLIPRIYFNWLIEVVCFASGRTSLLKHQYPEKRQLTNCWHFSATNVAIYYIIKEIY